MTDEVEYEDQVDEGDDDYTDESDDPCDPCRYMACEFWMGDGLCRIGMM